MTKAEYFSTMSDELLCECIKVFTESNPPCTPNLRKMYEVYKTFHEKYVHYDELQNDIFEEAAKRYLAIKMLQS